MSDEGESKQEPLKKAFSSRKKKILMVAIIIVVAGLIWKIFERSGEPVPTAGSSSQSGEIIYESDYARERQDSPLVSNLSTNTSSRSLPDLGGNDRSGSDALFGDKSKWSDAAIRLGLSFFVAMIIGSMLRAFVKTVVVAGVLVGAAYWFMLHQGMVEPMWEPDVGMLETAKVWAVEQTETVKGFLKGSLPSSVAAGVGFFLGLRH